MHRALLFSLISSMTVLAAAPQRQSLRRPLVFEPNQGQAPSHVKWIARGPGYQLLLTSQGVTMMVQESLEETPKRGTNASLLPFERLRGAASKPKYSAVRMKLEGSRPWNELTGLEPTGGVSNYLNGNDETHWRRGIPHYARVSAAGVYDGVDLVFYANGNDLEYDFVVKPGTDPGQIRLAFDGQERMRVDDKSGDLILTTAGGSEVRQVRPKVYQQVDGHRMEVAGSYQVLDRGRAGFALASYDRRRPLVIDPTVAFTTFLAGNDEDNGAGIAVDGSGNAYVVGSTLSTNFPTNDASMQWDQPDWDGFLVKLSPAGNILFSTYLGGNDKDYGGRVAVDSTGVYILGTTASTDFPLGNSKRNHFQEGFVSKIHLDGSGFIYTTLLGDPFVGGITVDPATHEVYATGSGRNDSTGVYHVLLLRLAASGSQLHRYYFGGITPNTCGDLGLAIALDHNSDVWVTGETCSPDFPIVNWPRQQLPSTGVTGFVAKWNSGLDTLYWSRYWGEGLGIAVGMDNSAYIAGNVFSQITSPFFSTPGAFQPDTTSQGSAQFSAFVTRFSPSGAVVNSTYFHGFYGSSDTGTWATSIALNAAGEVYIGGASSEGALPGTGFLTDRLEGFVSRLSPDLSGLRHTELLGAYVFGVAVLDTAWPFTPSQIYTTGERYTSGLASSNLDAFVVKLNDDAAINPVSPLLRLRNFWKSDECINIESGPVTSGPIQPGWWSAMWTLEQVPGTTLYRIRNRWQPSQYLNIESGALTAGPIDTTSGPAFPPGWWSAMWTFEQVPGTTLYRIRNWWKPSQYLNIESGALTAGPIVTNSPTGGWWSAMWTLEPVI